MSACSAIEQHHVPSAAQILLAAGAQPLLQTGEEGSSPLHELVQVLGRAHQQAAGRAGGAGGAGRMGHMAAWSALVQAMVQARTVGAHICLHVTLY